MYNKCCTTFSLLLLVSVTKKKTQRLVRSRKKYMQNEIKVLFFVHQVALA